MGRWTDIATWEGPAANNFGDGDWTELEPSDAMSRHDLVVIHIAEGSYAGTISWEDDPNSDISSHFVLAADGQITQMVDTHDRSWCQKLGNSTGISVECAGHTPNQLTDAQLTGVAKILAKASQEYGIPLRVAATAAERGLGHHSMDPAWGHQDCPGPNIIAQKPEIVRRAQQILGGAPPTTTPPTEEAPAMAFLYKINGTDDVWLYDGGTRRHLFPEECQQIVAIHAQMGLWNNAEVLNLACHVGAPTQADLVLYRVDAAPTPEERDEIWATDGTSRWHIPDPTALTTIRTMGTAGLIALAADGAVQSAACHIGEPAGQPISITGQDLATALAPSLAAALTAPVAALAGTLDQAINAVSAAGTHLASAGASLAAADDTPLLPAQGV
jgi:hypothetical protein